LLAVHDDLVAGIGIGISRNIRNTAAEHSVGGLGNACGLLPSRKVEHLAHAASRRAASGSEIVPGFLVVDLLACGMQNCAAASKDRRARSEEHTSELQSRGHLVCRLLLEK